MAKNGQRDVYSVSVIWLSLLISSLFNAAILPFKIHPKWSNAFSIKADLEPYKSAARAAPPPPFVANLGRTALEIYRDRRLLEAFCDAYWEGCIGCPHYRNRLDFCEKLNRLDKPVSQEWRGAEQ